MEVILRDDVVGVGDVGDRVRVKPGFARNYLIPQGLAIESGAKSAKIVAHHMLQIEKRRKELKTEAEGLAEKVRNTTLKMGLRVASGGKVFGSITARDIAKTFSQQNFEIDRRRINLAEPIKKIGVHLVDVKLHAEVSTKVKIEVEEIKATKKEEEEEAKLAKGNVEAASDKKKSAASEAEDETDSGESLESTEENIEEETGTESSE